MIDNIKELIVGYFPTITSVVAVVASVITSLGTIKKLFSKSENLKEQLQESLNKVKEIGNSSLVEAQNELGKLNEFLCTELKRNETLNEEISNLKSVIANTDEIIKQNAALKKQLTVFLRGNNNEQDN